MIKVTCENDHYIAEIEKEIIPGEVVSSDIFLNYAEGVKNFKGQPIVRRCCPQCDALVFKTIHGGGGLYIHTERGWLPKV